MIKTLIFLCLATVVANEVHYFIRPSSQSQCYEQCSNAECSMNNGLTLSQFLNNSIDYLMNDTRLILSPGNYSLESVFIVENLHYFSMTFFMWPISLTSSKAIITCGPNARFEFRNVSHVAMSGLEFVGCFESQVVSVGCFLLKSSGFFGYSQATVNGTVLIIDGSTATLESVMFVSVIDEPLPTPQELLGLANSTGAQINFTTDQVIGILLKRSNISITHGWFEGNNVGPIGAVIYDEFGSDITIINTTFVNNSAAYNINYTSFMCKCYSDCSATSGIIYTKSLEGTITIYESKFIQNVGVVIFGDTCNMLITHAKFINNTECSGSFATVFASDTNLDISYSIFTNNTGSTVLVVCTNISIRYSEFIGNNEVLKAVSGLLTSIDDSRFINNTGKGVLATSNNSMISVTQCEFVGNTAAEISLVLFDGVWINVHLNKFINNVVVDSAVV